MRFGPAAPPQAELEALLRGYFELYANTSALGLFKWPVSLDHTLPVGRVVAANPAALSERDHAELGQMLSTAEATLTRPQPGTKSALLLGLDVLEQKIDWDARTAGDLERAIARDFEEPLRELEGRLASDFPARVAKLKEKNLILLEKALRVEEKLQFFAKKTGAFEVRVAAAADAEGALNECAAAVGEFERRGEDLRHFCDQRQGELVARGEEGNRASAERLSALLRRRERGHLLDYLERMKAGVEALHHTVAECEQEARELAQLAQH